jgi:hypothetical protein
VNQLSESTKMRFPHLILALFVASAGAYNSNSMSRRKAFESVVASGTAAAFIANPIAANAIDSCPKGSSNCIRTTWTPPAGNSKDDAIAALKQALESYPQEGQNKADLGGWTLVDDNFSSGSARIEYKSGLGNMAKYFNGGKPFIDDLKLEISDSGVVEVRSASRAGDSDFGVNQKRLEFLVGKLTASGWNAPTPAY